MKQPIKIDVDPSIPAAYLSYAEGEVARTLDVTEDCSVAVDIDSDGTPLGIELLDFNEPDVIAAARAYAKEHGLAFPRDLSGVLGSA